MGIYIYIYTYIYIYIYMHTRTRAHTHLCLCVYSILREAHEGFKCSHSFDATRPYPNSILSGDAVHTVQAEQIRATAAAGVCVLQAFKEFEEEMLPQVQRRSPALAC